MFKVRKGASFLPFPISKVEYGYMHFNFMDSLAY